MSEIDHEAAKKEATKISEANKWLIDNGFSKLGGNLMAYAYLEMVEQRDYWRTIVQEGVGGLPVEKVTTEAELQTQLAAERARVEALEKNNDQRYRDLAGLLQIWNNLCETLTNISGRNSQQIPIWNLPNDNAPSDRAMNYITELAAERDDYKQQLATILEGRDHA